LGCHLCCFGRHSQRSCPVPLAFNISHCALYYGAAAWSPGIMPVSLTTPPSACFCRGSVAAIGSSTTCCAIISPRSSHTTSRMTDTNLSVKFFLMPTSDRDGPAETISVAPIDYDNRQSKLKL